MLIKNFAIALIALFFTFFSAAPLFAQEEEVIGELEEPSDTTDNELVAKGGAATFVPVTDANLRERMNTLTSCLDLRVNGTVKGYVKTYTVQKPEKARNMLGKCLTYFNLFEQKLREHGMPEDIKYLAVVESALNPKAVSRVGATGLWQFMPSTGSDYGLRTNSAVEDRSNPVKSTDAACRYLKALYNEFYNDWALAMAAYNSGPGRVHSAIKRARSRSFWAIQRYLPRETSNYVPAFIAATYICNYYQDHGLRPNYPDLDEQVTAYINVYEGISFRDISEATGIPYSLIKTLNPGFRRDYVPPSSEGHFVIVPERVMPAFVRYLNNVSSARQYQWDGASTNSDDLGDGRYYETSVRVNQAESVDVFARKLGLCGAHLRAWNKINSPFVYPDQELKLFHPVYVQKHSGGVKPTLGAGKAKMQPAKPAGDASKPAGSPAPVEKPQEQVAPRRRPTPGPEPGFQYHTVGRNESLEDIARQYATSVEKLRVLNAGIALKPGIRIKIRGI